MKKAASYLRACQNLTHAIDSFRKFPDNDLYRDALIQRFEIATELAWKSMKEYLEEQGLYLPVITPKAVLKEAFAAGIIQQEQVWVQILKGRNLTSCIYDEATAVSIANAVCSDFIPAFHALQSFWENQKI